MDPRAFLDEFRTEASEHLQALDARLLDLERDPSNPLAVREMFLSAHTLKGGAAMLGLAIVRDLSHALEDMLASLRDQRRTFDSDTADLLFRVVDALRERAGRATPDAPASDPAAAQVIALVRAWSAVLPAPAEPEAPLPPGPAAPRVLLVEHSATVRGLESLLLEDAGFEVEALANGQEALERALAQHFDLVVTGIENRGLRGLDLAAELRRSFSAEELPIVLMSSDDHAEQRARAAEIGVQAYIRKGSFGQQRLVQAARDLIGTGETQEPGAALAETVEPSTSAAPGAGDRPPIAGAGRAAPLVLIVDDSGLNRRVVRGGLEQLGYLVGEASDGAEALAALARTRYAAVLMDCQMPRMDGFETTTRLRRLEPPNSRTPVIALTATLTPADIERCMEAGMDDYLAKPTPLDELEETLRRWIVTPAPGDLTSPANVASQQERATEAGIDLDAVRGLVEIAGPGDQEALDELIGLFLDESVQRLARLRTALEQRDARALQRAAHAMKGSAGTFGAREMRDLSDRIERLALAGAFAESAALVDAVHEAFGRARPVLESFGAGAAR